MGVFHHQTPALKNSTVCVCVCVQVGEGGGRGGCLCVPYVGFFIFADRLLTIFLSPNHALAGVYPGSFILVWLGCPWVGAG